MIKPPDHKYELIRQSITFSTIILTLFAIIIVASAWISGNKNIDNLLPFISILVTVSSLLIALVSWRQRE
jgi:hypothetical protein